jgi:hypothetical protein
MGLASFDAWEKRFQVAKAGVTVIRKYGLNVRVKNIGLRSGAW